MSIRIPLQTVLSATNANELGVGSVAGGVAHPFLIQQDTDNVVVKFTASVVGAYSATFQTSDDGGTTYYDVARTSIVSNANNTTAEWLSVPVITTGINPQVISTVNAGSVLGGSIGSAAASVLGNKQVSGLPILGVQNRVFVRITGTVTSAAANTYTVQVKANSQSATA
jgi:hypothetical protein